MAKTVHIARITTDLLVIAKEGEAVEISHHLFGQYEKWLWLHNYCQMQLDQIMQTKNDVSLPDGKETDN